MAHAYLDSYACLGAYTWIITRDPNISDLHPFLSNLGPGGHGPEWLRLIYALEIAASEYLGLGKIDLIWRSSVKNELAEMKMLREDVAGVHRSTVDKANIYFGEVISKY